MSQLSEVADFTGHICDLCASTKPITLYSCTPFSMPSTPEAPEPSGVKIITIRACADCAALIDAGNWDALAARTLAMTEAMTEAMVAGGKPRPSEPLRYYVDILHGQLRRSIMRRS